MNWFRKNNGKSKLKNMLDGAGTVLQLFPTPEFKYYGKTDEERLESVWKEIGEEFSSIVNEINQTIEKEPPK